MYWVRGFVLQGLRALNLTAEDFEAEAGQVNATTAHAVERFIGIVAPRSRADRDRAVGARRSLPHRCRRSWARFDPGRRCVREPGSSPSTCRSSIRSRRTTGGGAAGSPSGPTWRRPVPSSSGTTSPSCPTDMGFYDLRLDETVAPPGELAPGDAGIAGFMYYHYWFAGRQLLDGPIKRAWPGDVDLPFCLMWANENWTRRWDGREIDVLMGQDYEEVASRAFIEDVLPHPARPAVPAHRRPATRSPSTGPARSPTSADA